MTRRLDLDEVVAIVDATVVAEYGGYQWPLAERIVNRLLDEGLFDPTQIEVRDE